MTWAPVTYATLTELKAHLRITDTADDTELTLSLTAACRAVDQFCNRQFGATGSAVNRLYTWHGDCIDGRPALQMDDLSTTTGLVFTVDTDEDNTYDTTLTLNTDFDLYPWNAAAESKPWTHAVLRPSVASLGWIGRTWPRNARAFSVTGNWGWAAVPSEVEIATLVQAARFFVRRDAPFGIAGSPDLGSEVRLQAKVDPDVALLLSSVRRGWGAV